MTATRTPVFNMGMAVRYLISGFLLAVFFAAMGSLGAGKTHAEPIASSKKLIDKFEQTIFKVNLWGPMGLHLPVEPFDHVVKWQSRPLFSINDEKDRLRKEFPEKWKFLDHLMIELTRLTDIWIRKSNWETRNSTNFHFYYFGQREIYDHFKEIRQDISSEWDLNIPPVSLDEMAAFRCTSYVNWEKNFRISQGYAFVLQGLERDLLHHCLVKSVTGALGLFADSDVLQPSIFGKDGVHLDYLPLNDKIILRTLYDKRIKPGMPKDEAMKFAAEIIPELVKAVKAKGVEALYQK